MSCIDAYIRSWKQSLPTVSHGTLVERRILSKIDPTDPSMPGALMNQVKSFSRAILEGHESTVATVHKDEQEVFYVVDGEGGIEAEGVVGELSGGSAILIPPKVSHRIVNTTRNPLELLVVVEGVPPGSIGKIRKKVLLCNYHTLSVSHVAHWSMLVKVLFESKDGLVTLHDVLVVTIDGMSIGEPHPHVPGTDEVWYQLKGTSLLFLGREIRRQHAGEAFMVPPDGRTSHSSINYTDEPMQWFYFSHFP